MKRATPAGQMTFALTRAPLPVLEPMARAHGMATSAEAASVVEPHLSALQSAVLSAFARHGHMTAKECEELPEFAHLGASTCRKRICECARAGHLVAVGTDRSGRAPLTIWRKA